MGNPTDKQGFTLIEMTISISILSLLFLIGFFIASDTYRSYLLQSERDLLITTLQSARAQAMANDNGLPHGIHAESAKFTMFEGSAYDPSDPLNSDIARNGSLDLAGPSEIIFQPLSGEVAAPGTYTLSNGMRQVFIYVNKEGRIQWQ